MWNTIALSVSAVTLLFLLSHLKPLRSKHLSFLSLAIWARYCSSAFHETTFDPLVAGFSINALGAIFVVALGIIMMKKSSWSMRHLIPFYTLLCAILVSGVVTSEFVGLINTVTKWLYFCVIAMYTYESMRKHGQTKVFHSFLYALALPVSLQIISLILGNGKNLESDGSVSFIGGYQHEAVFSVILLTFFTVLSLAKRGTVMLHLPLLGLAILGLIMANYRTAILATLPLLVVLLFSRTVGVVDKTSRIYVLGFTAVIIAISAVYVGTAWQARYEDVLIVLQNSDVLFKEPKYFTDEDIKLFSGRIYIWSQYLTPFLKGDWFTYLFGFGPDSWEGVIDLYAHNTFVSYVYEFGFVGLFAFMYLVFGTFFRALKVRSSRLKMLAAAHASFIVLNLSTMPIWQIEGMILYGILSGYTWYLCFSENQKPVSDLDLIKAMWEK